MQLRSTLPFVLTALAAGASGWLLATAVPPDTPAPTRAAQAARPPLPKAADAIRPPQVLVSSDGNATLHVEQQPLAWVIEQIVAQGGWVEGPAAAVHPSAAPATAAAEPTPARAPKALIDALERGSDDERRDALLQARDQQLTLPDGLLQTRWETDASEAVRWLALEAQAERLAGDPQALRSLLQAARLAPSATLQQRAAAWLDDLDERERANAAHPQPGVPPG